MRAAVFSQESHVSEKKNSDVDTFLYLGNTAKPQKPPVPTSVCQNVDNEVQQTTVCIPQISPKRASLSKAKFRGRCGNVCAGGVFQNPPFAP